LRKILLVSGAFLLLVGLLLGTALDRFASPEIASDAHVAGVQHGMLLMLFGIAWRYVSLERIGLVCALLNIIGLFGIWAAFLLGAMLGEPYPAASAITSNMFIVSSWILIAGVAVYLYGLLKFRDR